MAQKTGKPNKLRSTLIIIIFATLPCYLLGMIVLWVGNSLEKKLTTITATLSLWNGQPSATFGVIPTSPPFPTTTPTITNTPAPTATFVIPSDTPTSTITATTTATPSPSPSHTATVTETIAETTESP
jgi:hypothetical protein